VRVTRIVVLTLALTGSDRISFGGALQAQNGAAAVRGSWVTESTGARYLDIFAVQDDRISGSSARDASISTTLRLYRRAGSKGDGLSFTLVHDRGDQKPYREMFRGTVVTTRS